MTTKTKKLETIKGFFNKDSTVQFVKEIDYALRSVNLVAIKKVFKDYGVYHLESTQDFIGQLHCHFFSLKKEGVDIVLIQKAKPRLSKCIGCSFGSNIKAYKYEYKQRHFLGSGKIDYCDVVYEKEFGILFKIENKIINDIGICNAFLTEQECKELN